MFFTFPDAWPALLPQKYIAFRRSTLRGPLLTKAVAKARGRTPRKARGRAAAGRPPWLLAGAPNLSSVGLQDARLRVAPLRRTSFRARSADKLHRLGPDLAARNLDFTTTDGNDVKRQNFCSGRVNPRAWQTKGEGGHARHPSFVIPRASSRHEIHLQSERPTPGRLHAQARRRPWRVWRSVPCHLRRRQG